MSDAEEIKIQPPRSRPWLRLLLMLVIFLSGMIVGVGGTLIFIRNQVQHSLQHPEEAPQRLAKRVQRVLGLSESKRDKIEQLIRDRQEAIQGIRRDFQPKFERELDKLGEEISAVLHDKQRDVWEQWYGELRERWIPRLPPKSITDQESAQ